MKLNKYRSYLLIFKHLIFNILQNLKIIMSKNNKWKLDYNIYLQWLNISVISYYYLAYYFTYYLLLITLTYYLAYYLAYYYLTYYLLLKCLKITNKWFKNNYFIFSYKKFFYILNY